MSAPELEEVDPGTPMADVATADLVDLGPQDCGVPHE